MERMLGLRNGNMETKKVVGVAIERNKGSQIALKWAIDNYLQSSQTVVLIHVDLKSSSPRINGQDNKEELNQMQNQENVTAQQKELFLPFHCFCTRKEIQCHDVWLEGNDIGKALIDYVAQSGIDVLVVGGSSKQGFLGIFKTSTDLTGSLMKGIPDFCNLYVVNKGKVSSSKSATSSSPPLSHLRDLILNQPIQPETIDQAGLSSPKSQNRNQVKSLNKLESIKSPLYKKWAYGELTRETASMDASNSSSDNSSDTNSDISGFSSFTVSNSSLNLNTNESSRQILPSTDVSFTSSCEEGDKDDYESEMCRLKQQLKQNMEIYTFACEEVKTATQKVNNHRETKIEVEVEVKEDAIKTEDIQSEDTIKYVQINQKNTDDSETEDIKGSFVASKFELGDLNGPFNCRVYTIEEIEAATLNFSDSVKIGEGGFGFVYKGVLDGVSVAIKVLRPDANQGWVQFQREVEVLSNIRHPNMVLLRGVCPEYGCLVYEYLSNGNLEDLLSNKGHAPPLTWRQRFRISAEIATGLLFLHRTKPEPTVHRDLKPANILLDSNYISKISDVGLARLVPPTITEKTTQYRMTTAAGTFCYIDPEYQQTGLLGVKSDVYSLGVMLLQIITGKSPMGLTHSVESAIENGTFDKMLDPVLKDWPVEEALSFAKMSLKCTELRRRDRPDLEKEILPELLRLRAFADEDANANSSL